MRVSYSVTLPKKAKKHECDSMPGELRKKIKKILLFLGIEIVILAVASMAVFFSSEFDELIPAAARFLGAELFFHLYLGWKELQEFKQPPVSEGEL